MDDQSEKNPQKSTDMKDLLPKNLDKDVEANVKGGAEPISDSKGPKRAEPISDFR